MALSRTIIAHYALNVQMHSNAHTTLTAPLHCKKELAVFRPQPGCH
jgi:hypothetical protein